MSLLPFIWRRAHPLLADQKVGIRHSHCSFPSSTHTHVPQGGHLPQPSRSHLQTWRATSSLRNPSDSALELWTLFTETGNVSLFEDMKECFSILSDVSVALLIACDESKIKFLMFILQVILAVSKLCG